MLDELVSMQTLPATVADQLRGTVAARANILISGGTSSGKTTLLNALAATIPDHERILLIEAPSEIVLHKRNLIRLEARLEEIPMDRRSRCRQFRSANFSGPRFALDLMTPAESVARSQLLAVDEISAFTRDLQSYGLGPMVDGSNVRMARPRA